MEIAAKVTRLNPHYKHSNVDVCKTVVLSVNIRLVDEVSYLVQVFSIYCKTETYDNRTHILNDRINALILYP